MSHKDRENHNEGISVIGSFPTRIHIMVTHLLIVVFKETIVAFLINLNKS